MLVTSSCRCLISDIDVGVGLPFWSRILDRPVFVNYHYFMMVLRFLNVCFSCAVAVCVDLMNRLL